MGNDKAGVIVKQQLKNKETLIKSSQCGTWELKDQLRGDVAVKEDNINDWVAIKI